MNNKDNELFNGIIDIENHNTDNENYSQSNYVQSQIKSSMEVIDIPMDINQSQLQPEVIDVQSVFEAPMSDEAQSLRYNNNLNDVQNTNSVLADSPEIIDFGANTQIEQVNETGKSVNHELLKNLSEDTNNLVNPDMIINPFGKQNESASNVNIQEPKVDYDEIKTKKGYVFMAIIFLIIIVFIIFLPQIMSLLGI